jgi:hypothetical protein
MEVKARKVTWFAQKSGCVIGTIKMMPRYIIISVDTDKPVIELVIKIKYFIYIWWPDIPI